jgi:hypothetical protein
MKMLTLAAILTTLSLGGAAQAAPVLAQTSPIVSEGVITQVRDRSMGEGNMRGMRHGSNMRGMRHGSNMRGMRRGGGMQHGGGRRGMGNMGGMNHGM